MRARQQTLLDIRGLCEQLDPTDPFTVVILRSRRSLKFRERLIDAYLTAKRLGTITSDDLPHVEHQYKDVCCPKCFYGFQIPNVYGDRINGAALKVLQKNRILIHTGRMKSKRRENHATTVEIWEFNPNWWRET